VPRLNTRKPGKLDSSINIPVPTAFRDELIGLAVAEGSPSLTRFARELLREAVTARRNRKPVKLATAK
jgi:hypothetical protein